MKTEHRTPNTEHRKTALPFFSIIIPVYNVAPYLRECLDSVLAQTFTDWECLCVDDGSTDESGAILDEYAHRDPRFRVFHKRNAGVSAARNLALDNAKGEWIGFLDGDDIVSNLLLSLIARNTIGVSARDIIRFDYKKFNENSCCVFNVLTKNTNTQVLDFTLGINGALLLKKPFSCHFYAHEVISDIRFPRQYAMGEDQVFLLTALLNDVRCLRILDVECYGYRQRKGSVMNTSMSPKMYIEILSFYLDICEQIEASNKKIYWSKFNKLDKDIFLCGYLRDIYSNQKRFLYADQEKIIKNLQKEKTRILGLQTTFSWRGLVCLKLYLLPFGYWWKKLVVFFFEKMNTFVRGIRFLYKYVHNLRYINK